MPIYDQMSGWRVKAERQPCQNLGFFGPVGSAKALMRLRLSKNFLRPTYVDQVLVPELRPGDVVVFDNLKPHLSRHVAESIERAGATVLPLPPYSSDYDPIEELWSKFKGQLRRIAARTKDGLYKAVGETLDSVTIQDILGWFNHSGLYATHG